MTEQETAEIHAMVREFEALIDSSMPEGRAARFKLHRLATTTGDEWEEIAREYLAERAAHNTASWDDHLALY